MRVPLQLLLATLAACVALAVTQLGCRNEQVDAPTIEPTLTATNKNHADAPEIADADLPPGEIDERVTTITFDDLKIEIDKGALYEESMLTPDIKAMIGRRISIRGFMHPTYQSKGIAQFVLLQRKDCPFGTPEAYVHHSIYVKLNDGFTTSFTRDPVTVEGVLSIDPKKGRRGGKEFHIAIYRFDEAEVR